MTKTAPTQKTSTIGVDFKILAKSIAESGFWLVIAAYIFFFWQTAAYLSEGPWQTDKDSHGLFILIIVAAITAIRFKALSKLNNRPSITSAMLIGTIGFFFFLLGRSQSQILFEMGANIFILASLVLLIKGWDGLRLLWFPLLFLGFAVPLPGWFLDGSTQFAKLAISDTVTNGLHSFGYPIGHNGVTIQIGRESLLVEDACSGLNSLYSLGAVGVLYTYITRSASYLRNGILVLWILPAALLSNLVRVALLVLITFHFGKEAGQGFLHDFAGFLMFFVALLSFFILDRLLLLIPTLNRKKMP